MRLPTLLQDTSNERPLDVLTRYYTVGEHSGAAPFTGARFDTWDSTATRAADVDRFTADDLVAVCLLSVDVPAPAAIQLLDTRSTEFAALLVALGPDRELASESPWSEDWAGWRIWTALRGLPGVGPTTASKLLARKRPRLRPIYDSVVAGVIGSEKVWEPLRAALADDPSLQERLISLRDAAGLPDAVSAIRVFDVLAWMEGKGEASPHR